ncbi:hypothetical protein TNCV_341671 [Trichonephila clavipes]|nr:hypothetical protein TNCV_341671 [Trichonephila clavipes]
MITNFFIPELSNHDVQELWFQQDGATCHTARATIDLLKDTFGDRLISRFGPGNWPPRSCDLTPLDYFLWGYVKSLVYADKPQTLDHLEDNIRRVIADIRPQMLEKVIENWTSRLDYNRASRSSPMPEIKFKISRVTIFPLTFNLLSHLCNTFYVKRPSTSKVFATNNLPVALDPRVQGYRSASGCLLRGFVLWRSCHCRQTPCFVLHIDKAEFTRLEWSAQIKEESVEKGFIRDAGVRKGSFSRAPLGLGLRR